MNESYGRPMLEQHASTHDPGEYEPPAGVVLGTLRDLTAGEFAGADDLEGGTSTDPGPLSPPTTP